jgi:hypothetical protein
MRIMEGCLDFWSISGQFLVDYASNSYVETSSDSVYAADDIDPQEVINQMLDAGSREALSFGRGVDSICKIYVIVTRT